jgi:tetratricopeptide (TPR) repeat protein
LAKLPARPPDWRFPAARRLRTIPAHFSAVKDAAFTPDGERLLTASFDDTVKIWDAWDRGDTDAATRAFQEARGVDPSYPRIAYDLGATHQYIARTRNDPRELDQAKASYAKTVALDPKDELAKGAMAALGE